MMLTKLAEAPHPNHAQFQGQLMSSRHKVLDDAFRF
jgi:hypothetical protein